MEGEGSGVRSGGWPVEGSSVAWRKGLGGCEVKSVLSVIEEDVAGAKGCQGRKEVKVLAWKVVKCL